ncbi:unnamed protein product [Rhizophagus irregularis]|uniref:Uncharacterized protein n=1 Tax=Rhizophagus irregularis TaxID=588596 RepID=A0A915ZSX4_9GLOM|nr:unnamed protein product [Rhizophagus irregularis]
MLVIIKGLALRWLHKFKNHNGIHQQKLEGEVSSADEAAIANALPLLREYCSNYPLKRIYNMDETELFYRCCKEKKYHTYLAPV